MKRECERGCGSLVEEGTVHECPMATEYREMPWPMAARPLVVLDVDAFVDGRMTDEERVAHTALACEQLKACGYMPVLVRAGARVEVLGCSHRPGAESRTSNILVVDADAGLGDGMAKQLMVDGWHIIYVKPGSRVERL